MNDGLVLIVFWLVGALAAVMIGAAAYAVYDGVTAEKFYLRKNEWTCSAAHRSFTGKYWITVCDQWNRR